MEVLKVWENEASCPQAFQNRWFGGKVRVFKCKDQFGNFVIWVETDYIGHGVQGASVVFAANEENLVDVACEQMFRKEKPFVEAVGERPVAVHKSLFRVENESDGAPEPQDRGG